MRENNNPKKPTPSREDQETKTTQNQARDHRTGHHEHENTAEGRARRTIRQSLRRRWNPKSESPRSQCKAFRDCKSCVCWRAWVVWFEGISEGTLETPGWLSEKGTRAPKNVYRLRLDPQSDSDWFKIEVWGKSYFRPPLRDAFGEDIFLTTQFLRLMSPRSWKCVYRHTANPKTTQIVSKWRFWRNLIFLLPAAASLGTLLKKMSLSTRQFLSLRRRWHSKGACRHTVDAQGPPDWCKTALLDKIHVFAHAPPKREIKKTRTHKTSTCSLQLVPERCLQDQLCTAIIIFETSLK